MSSDYMNIGDARKPGACRKKRSLANAIMQIAADDIRERNVHDINSVRQDSNTSLT